MRITRLKLVNFIGIKVGLGLDEIEIDFTKGKNKIVQFNGKNGSGKSVIMSQLHPYKESFDARPSIILEGKEGRKEIDYEYNGHKYEIVHIYSKSAQSFFKEDGVELNENGSVKLCEGLIKEKLGCEKSYLKIGKIGSNTEHFVDFTSTERKAYMSTFLNTEDIQEKYKIVREKYNVLKKELDSIANDLKRYQPKDVIETEIQNLSKSTDEIDKELNELYAKQGSLQTSIDRDKKDIGDTNLATLQTRITEKEAEIESSKATKTKLEAELTDLENSATLVESLTNDITKLQSDIQVNNSEVMNKNLLITATENKINSTQLELSALGNPEDITKLQNELDAMKKEADETKERIKSNSEAQLVKDLLKEKKDVSRLLNKFIDFTNFIEKYFSDLAATSITNDRSNISYFFDDDFDESFKRQIEDSKDVITAKQALLQSQQKERGIKEGYVCQLDNLSKRPHECSIDDCPFIKDALLHKNVLAELSEKDAEIEQTKKDLKVLNTKAENLQLLQTLYQQFLEAYKNVLPRDNEIYTEFIKSTSLVDKVCGSLADFQTDRQTLIDNVNNAIADIGSYLDLQSRINITEKSKKTLEDADSSVREKYEKDINENTERLNQFKSEASGLIKKGETLAASLTEKQELLGKYQEYVAAISKIASSGTMLSTAKSEFARLSTLITNKSQSELELTKTTTRITELTTLKNQKNEKLIELKTALGQIDALNKKLTKTNANFKPVETVMESLSPSKGIQLILTNLYLAETQTIANELLDVAFGGEFSINFNVGPKDFFIEVATKDGVKPDIKMASQGEIAITTISLSLALIEQSISNYNIICLDEIDGPLDRDNRQNFINILTSQMDKLDIEQLFVISHNDAFDTADTDLVLLKGNTVDKSDSNFMKNKTIIFENEGVN